ncbi:MAG: XRE family transcriptional regulator [Rhodospirillaceae bacterium]|nr:XRE family transcriptional regulator [Rhodospirillaceae bacterium]MBL6940521.1 XRE family transcriptional regulator [Rhodospirillales bacterium]
MQLRTARLLAPRGLPRTDAAFYIGCSPRMFDGMVKNGDMPSPRLIGKKKVWDREELDEFFADLPRPQTNHDKNDWDDDESED